MPFNRFILENLAGDLLPNATVQSQIASGFNRNVTFNEEGGADPDEFYVAYAIDRANTTGQVFLGMTFGCAQCHDHKYDPISSRDYYGLAAVFSGLDRLGKVVASQAERERHAVRMAAAQRQVDTKNAELEKTLGQPKDNRRKYSRSGQI